MIENVTSKQRFNGYTNFALRIKVVRIDALQMTDYSPNV